MKRFLVVIASLSILVGCKSSRVAQESSRSVVDSTFIQNKSVSFEMSVVDTTVRKVLPIVYATVPAKGCNDTSGTVIVPEGTIRFFINEGSMNILWKPVPVDVPVSINKRKTVFNSSDSTSVKSDSKKESFEKKKTSIGFPWAVFFLGVVVGFAISGWLRKMFSVIPFPPII